MEGNVFERYKGLSTQHSLENLCHVIRSYQNNAVSNRQCKLGFLKDSLHHTSPYTTFNWIFILIYTLCSIALMYFSFWVEGTILLSFVIFNIALVSWDNYLRYNELSSRISFVLKKLKRVCSDCNWKKEHFPHLCTPNAPSVSLQWTIRDDDLINLPSILLTGGDYVVIRPGQQSPTECCLPKNKDLNLSNSSLMAGEVYSCEESLYKLEQPSNPTSRYPFSNKVYKVLSAPIISHLMLLNNKFLNRPVSLYNRARHLLFTKWLLSLLAVVICITFLLLVVRLLVLSDTYESWVHVLILESCAIILTITPLMFPVIWFLLNVFGNALLLSCTVLEDSSSSVVFNTESVETQMKKTEIKFSPRLLLKLAIDIISGGGESLTRSSNLLHTLASITALCCVDKKGILSWPNPTAEKVFFLRDSSDETPVNNADEITKVGNLCVVEKDDKHRIEMLDLTHDNYSAWKLNFDDVLWKRHLSSLKPIGLAILLNTCNSKTHEHYSQFCAHITCKSLFTEHLVPVANRRCLCELARLIGFKETADKIFDLELQLSTYKNVGDIIQMDTKYMKTFFKRRKLKFPFPHMVAVTLSQYNNTNDNDNNCDQGESAEIQLFSQGTADIILDCCTDYWNGNSLKILTPNLRNRILDFYQRSSLTAYCTAFSYRPVMRNVDKNFKNVYIELPRDIKSFTSRYVDSCSDIIDITSLDGGGDKNRESDTIMDDTGCFRAQCNQVFLGMVSMQYQALTDMVQLIEELEKACVRFVHFSKENELRSRVFSEKMGLESGWNCHISLLGDYNSVAFSDSLACLGPMLSRPQNFDSSVSNNIYSPLKLISCTEVDESPYNASSGISSDTGKRRQSEDLQSSESDGSLTEEENVPFSFDMSNRSKLPRGIENIRPHLEQIDNVPLLVSLFTDCTPEATEEMISIMQENGETVCVIGSSANIHNVGVFVQADASISVDPLYPQVCQREPVIKEFAADENSMTPIQLSQLLNSIACSLTLRREDPLPIFHLIMQARHIMQHMWNCIQFWLCCIAVLTSVQLFALLFMLPAMFTVEQVLWLTCVVIPLLSVSLLTGSVDETVMNRATGKDWLCSSNIQILLYVLWCYGAKILLIVVCVVSIYCSTLYTLCHQYSQFVSINNTKGIQCEYVYPDTDISHDSWNEYHHILFFVRHATAFFLLLHYVALCASFFHRDFVFWKRVPCLNATWTVAVLFTILVQCIYIVNYELSTEHLSFMDISVPAAVCWIISPLVTFLICELIKVYEIRMNARYQKKVRLEFGTKLGMNSPF